MKAIEFDAMFGDEMKHVEIAWPSGANGVVYISINHYHQGQLTFQLGEWRAYLNTGTILTGDDITALIERIQINLKEE